MNENPAISILTVCTGNICRSPIAEGILKRYIAGKSGVLVASAGTHALENNPPTEFAVLVSDENGIDISHHRARRLDSRIVRESTFILCMERSHIEEVLSLDARASGKVYNLADFSGMQGKLRRISDPYGCGLPDYRECFRNIDDCIRNFLISGPRNCVFNSA
jgi:protein-tyrosine phosphatase